MWRRFVATWALGCAAAALVGACSTPQLSSGAPPLRVCGTVLWSGAEGATYFDESRSTTEVTSTSSGDAIYLKLSTGCDHGMRLLVPPGAATVARVARAHDRLLAAIALRPRRSAFDLRVVQPGAPARTIQVRLGKDP